MGGWTLLWNTAQYNKMKHTATSTAPLGQLVLGPRSALGRGRGNTACPTSVCSYTVADGGGIPPAAPAPSLPKEPNVKAAPLP